MKENIIKQKSFAFALRIISLFEYLKSKKKEYIISKQIMRSGTAIGALYREAEHAQSRADFINKLSIAQKECNETLYWLELLKEANYLEASHFESIYKDAVEIIKLITSIIKSSKSN